MADKKPPPKFKVGDKVTSFRGEKATVDRVRNVEHPGKSHRVGVTWEGKKGGPDAVDYYETVFDRTKAPAKSSGAKKVAAKSPQAAKSSAAKKAAPKKKT